MKILILGAGVIGVTTAYYLALDGHEVEVVDREEKVANETSFANAGQISPGYSAPWAGPGVPLKAIGWLRMKYGPLAIRPRIDPEMWRWMLMMLRNCSEDRYAVNKARMVPIAEYSRDCMVELRRATGISYDDRAQGTLQLFRDQYQLDGISKDVDVLRQFNVPYEILDRQGCIAAEPGLAHATTPFVGGLRLPRDETGDCNIFTQKLSDMARAAGVRFSMGINIRGIDVEAGRVTGVTTDQGRKSADKYIVACGSYSTALLRPVGISIPVFPVKGYSITIPITNPDAAPVSTVMDETYKTAITRLGDRIRVGGTAELAGFDLALRPERRKALEHSVGQMFPAGGDIKAASFWCGLRPMTPDGPPIIGKTKIDGLYLNTGHGTLGWTMACGSGKLLTDLIAGRPGDIKASDLSIERYGR